MKRKDLKDFNLTDEQIDAIMGMNGKDIEEHKTKLDELSKSSETITAQLAEANKQIEAFKGMKVEEIQKAAEEYKTKFEQAQTENASQIAQLKLDHAFETALIGKKARNLKAASSLFDKSQIKINEDGTLVGFDEQFEKIAKSDAYLFEESKAPEPTPKKPVPVITTKTNSQQIQGDALLEQLAKGAGVKPEDIKIK